MYSFYFCHSWLCTSNCWNVSNKPYSLSYGEPATEHPFIWIYIHVNLSSVNQIIHANYCINIFTYKCVSVNASCLRANSCLVKLYFSLPSTEEISHFTLSVCELLKVKASLNECLVRVQVFRLLQDWKFHCMEYDRNSVSEVIMENTVLFFEGFKV